MDRWACVDAFAFPLQVLLSLHPEWIDHPVAVLDRDHPRGRLLWLNQEGKRAGLRKGMPYGQALSLVAHLRAEALDAVLLKRRAERIVETLRKFSPRVESAPDAPGLFWLDASGLQRLHPDWKTWVEPLRLRLREEHHLYVAVVIGFRRFHTFALARSTRQSGLFHSPESEQQAADTIPLSDLELGPSSLELTRRLGIHTVGELLALPPESLRRRIGAEAFRLYRLARGDREEPLTNFESREDPTHLDHLDHAEKNTHRLLFLIKRHLHPLLEALSKEGEQLLALEMVLFFRDNDPLRTEIRPAEPTEDPLLILELVRLRLESISLELGVTSLGLSARGERTETRQMQLFVEASPRDVDAANRALARIRAEFGDQSVRQILLHNAHLPEARFSLAPMEKLTLPAPNASPELSPGRLRPAVRRFFPAPIHLSHPPTSSRTGPHIISGGWWIRPIHRAYHLIETADHRLLWIFFDQSRSRWYVHAEF